MKKAFLSTLAVTGTLLVGAIFVRPVLASRAEAQTAETAGDASLAAEGLRIRTAIQNDSVAPMFAPKDADVTVGAVLRLSMSLLPQGTPGARAALREDNKVKVVYRDWRIFGDRSVEAARVPIASQYHHA